MSFSQYHLILSHCLHIPHTLHFCNYKIQYVKFVTSKSNAYVHVIFWIFTNPTFSFKFVQFHSTLNIQYCHYTFSTYKKSISKCPYHEATGILNIWCTNSICHLKLLAAFPSLLSQIQSQQCQKPPQTLQSIICFNKNNHNLT